MNGAQLMVEMLLAHGVEHVFGVPGDTSLPLYDAFYAARGRLRHIMARDERSASFMADAYARAGRRPGVCEGPSGGGATYIVPGVAEANFSSVPLIVLTTDVPVAWEGKGELTAMDEVAALRASTKWSTQVKRVEQLPDAVRQAFRTATTGRPGAVHLALPEDILQAEMQSPDTRADTEVATYPAYRTRPDPRAIERAVATLIKAERPVILAGGGTILSRAWDELTALAEALAAPVATTINGKGSIAESHPLSLGVVGGNGGRPYANEFVRAADTLLCIGTRLNRVDTANRTLIRPRATLVQIDVDPTQIGNNYGVEVGVVGDAKLAIADLLAALNERQAGSGEPGAAARARAEEIASAAATFWGGVREKAAAKDFPLKPQTVIAELAAALPEDSVLVVDPGTMTPFVAAQFALERPGRRILCPRAHGGLGYAIPGVVGAKLARPGATVVGICGDGSFGMSCGDLDTIHRSGLPVVLLQMNNGCFGWIKMLQKLYCGERYFGVDFSADTDYAKVADGFGLRGVRVASADDLAEAIHSALRDERPSFIDVPTQPETVETPPVEAWQRALVGRR